jgi:uncharacterized protein
MPVRFPGTMFAAGLLLPFRQCIQRERTTAMIFDPLYLLLVAPAMLLAMVAQWRVKSAFTRGRQCEASMNGTQVARAILDRSGLHNIDVQLHEGFLSDHYDPRSKVVRLSPIVYHEYSLSAVGIAAHEVGHALQDAKHYAPLVIRNAAVPLAATGGKISMFVFIGGLMFGGLATVLGKGLLIGGIALFSCVVIFQLVNLPVEFNASTRAKAILADMGVATGQQAIVVKQVLDAAALTYVAATLSSVMTLLYMLIRSGLLGGRRSN